MDSAHYNTDDYSSSSSSTTTDSEGSISDEEKALPPKKITKKRKCEPNKPDKKKPLCLKTSTIRKKLSSKNQAFPAREYIMNQIKTLFLDKNKLHSCLVPVELTAENNKGSFKVFVPARIRSTGVAFK